MSIIIIASSKLYAQAILHSFFSNHNRAFVITFVSFEISGSEVQINPNAVQNVDNPLYIPSTELGAAQNELHRYEDVNVT